MVSAMRPTSWHLSTLAARPALQEQVIALIEEAFNYTPPYKFGEDFYPLFAENAAHNHLIMQGEELLGHVGVRLVTLTYQTKTLPVAMLGGIALKEKFRGQGIFKKAFLQILKLYEPLVACFLLWSDQAELYAKFGFGQAGSVLQLGEKTDLLSWLGQHQWRPYFPAETHFDDLIGQNIKTFYQAQVQSTLAINRTAHDWDVISQIKSAQFLVHPTNPSTTAAPSAALPAIDAYLVLGKGFDLPHVVHEIGGVSPVVDEFLRRNQCYKIWLPGTPEYRQKFPTAVEMYLGLFRIGNFALLAKFLGESAAALQREHTLQGPGRFWPSLWGPGSGRGPTIYISGLDSI